jgi:hypothetical protein
VDTSEARIQPVASKGPTQRQPSRRVATWLELINHTTDDTSKTIRTVALIITLALCAGGVLFVLQLDGDRWASAATVAVSVVGAVVGRRWSGKKGGVAPPADGGEPPQN